jgi:hypothetical protein
VLFLATRQKALETLGACDANLLSEVSRESHDTARESRALPRDDNSPHRYE